MSDSPIAVRLREIAGEIQQTIDDAGDSGDRYIVSAHSLAELVRRIEAVAQDAAPSLPPIAFDEDRLKWHVPDNLRWLAEQKTRPGRVPCGMLTGQFLIAVADRLEDKIAEPAAGTSAYEMVAAVEQQNVEVTETLIHMVAATVLSKIIDEEGGGRANISFSPADMDSMHQRYILHATHDGMLTTVKIEPRPGAFSSAGAPLRETFPGDPVIPLARDEDEDAADAKPQAEQHVYDRPLWAARVNGKLYPASDRDQAQRAVDTRISEEPDTVAQVENRFCYHDDCPAERCNHDERLNTTIDTGLDPSEVTSAAPVVHDGTPRRVKLSDDDGFVDLRSSDD